MLLLVVFVGNSNVVVDASGITAMQNFGKIGQQFNPLTPELNRSTQRCLTRFFNGDCAS
jgi:hypothetical protein